MLLRIFWTFLCCVSVVAYGQTAFSDSVAMLFSQQIKAFPQEKIYLHTDKSYYVAGETIWFRTHLADAAVHVPATVSRYVYVELIDPLDSVLMRVKLRPLDGCYAGRIDLPEDLPESSYELRAYTNFMRSIGEDYLYTRSIMIGHPQSRSIVTDTKFEFESDKRVSAEFRFMRPDRTPLTPETITVKVNNGAPMTLKAEPDGRAGITFPLPPDSKQRVLLLESIQDKYRYRQYITIPFPDDAPDVTFYPEGGALLAGTGSRVAFKAMRPDGRPANISGTIFDQEGNEISTFKTLHLGMGSFVLLPENGKSYFATIRYGENKQKKVELPQAQQNGHTLTCRWMRDRLYMAVLKPAGVVQQEPLYLIAHTRGLVHFTAEWEQKREFMSFAKNLFPSGVLHLLLVDRNKRPLSERLVFINNNDQAQVSFQPDKSAYASRSMITGEIRITAPENTPLPASFSVAVTDDSEVQTDSTSNILTSMLLTSDLKGKIENPAYYFREGIQPATALDLLMLTQGWRRYNLPDMLSGKFSRPTTFLEVGPEIDGTVKTLLMGKPEADIPVTILSLKGDYVESVTTDSLGHFYFRSSELPDSTRYIVQVMPGKGMKRFELIVNQDKYPPRLLQAVPAQINRQMVMKYGEKTEQKYTYENGIRNVYMDEITVTAARKPVRKSVYYSQPDNTITEDAIDRYHPSDIRMLLMQLPGVMVSGDKVSIRGQGDPLLMVDGLTMDISNLDMINVFDVAQVDVLKNASNTAMFGSQGANGVIVIFTKEGKVNFRPKPFHIKTILPLGYQQPVAFYAPKYDTPESAEYKNPDLRTTIHWEPNVRTDSTGVATLSFYTADAETSYSVIIEGIAADGKLIRHEGKLMRKEE